MEKQRDEGDVEISTTRLPKDDCALPRFIPSPFRVEWSSSYNGELKMHLPELRAIPPDLVAPEVTRESPTRGKRVYQTLAEYEGSEVHHVLYLPTDWVPSRTFPLIVESPGNGLHISEHGDVCTGMVEDACLGYGISGGERFLWLCLPFISPDRTCNQLQWWGSVEATVQYCKDAVRQVCNEFGGDPNRALLTGFSRGAIACNYVGLHDDEIASLWRGFVAHSHYDGVRKWGYPGDDRRSALQRLQRMHGRPQFISHEGSTQEVEQYLRFTGVQARFTFQPLPFRNHTDTWALRDLPERRRLRQWVRSTVASPSKFGQELMVALR